LLGWKTYKMRVVLLAGGMSKRMGRDKLFLPIKGKPFLQLMIERLLHSDFLVSIITNKGKVENIKNILPSSIVDKVSIFEDVYPDKGPVGGIYSGLLYSSEPFVFVLAADLPFFKPELMKAMEESFVNQTALIPETEKGYEPLFAIYGKKSQAVFLRMIQEDDLKISNSYQILSTSFFTPEMISKYDPTNQSFININTQQDYEEIIRLE
jgi:molybdopterin-guanine dinucleotide biosynthesis protein A